jgi:gamma-glutamylcyclotransferase (GGCT)/AIG2-like uncharacterized protein YtfP
MDETNTRDTTETTNDTPPDGHVRLFVYGLLKRGYGLGTMIEEQGAQFIRTAVLDGHSIYGSGVAMMLPNPRGHVEGEVWDVPEAVMPTVDRIEAGYRRTPITLRDGLAAEAYVSLYEEVRKDAGPYSVWPSVDHADWRPRIYRSRFLPSDATAG